MMLQIFPHVVFRATSRGKFFYLAREIIFAILAFFAILSKLLLKFYYTHLPFSRIAQYLNPKQNAETGNKKSRVC